MIYKEVIYKRADMAQLDRLKDNRNFSMFGSNDLLYIVGYYNAVTKELENITIVQFAEDSDSVYEAVSGVTTNDPYKWLATNIQNIDSERLLAGRYQINFKLRIDADKARWDSTTTNWIFMNGAIRYMISSNASVPEENFTSRSFAFVQDPPRYFEKVWYNVDAMTLYEGVDYIKRLKKSHQEWKGEQARLLSKLSYPVGVIFVVLIGIGLANVGNRKSSFIINFITSLGLFLVYYLFFSTGLALCSKGTIEPFTGAFMGTIVFTIVAIVLYAAQRLSY
jgi:lipopolysaccharide export LptBFGC system permease protein LptF